MAVQPALVENPFQLIDRERENAEPTQIRRKSPNLSSSKRKPSHPLFKSVQYKLPQTGI